MYYGENRTVFSRVVDPNCVLNAVYPNCSSRKCFESVSPAGCGKWFIVENMLVSCQFQFVYISKACLPSQRY